MPGAGKNTLYTLNNNAGAFVDIPATIWARYVRMREDESGTAQGLEYKLPDDGFTAVFVVGTPSGPNIPQIERGNLVGIQDAVGVIVGMPAQNTANGTTAFNYRAADVMAKVRSHGASGTKLRVEEFD